MYTLQIKTKMITYCYNNLILNYNAISYNKKSAMKETIITLL